MKYLRIWRDGVLDNATGKAFADNPHKPPINLVQPWDQKAYTYYTMGWEWAQKHKYRLQRRILGYVG